MPVHDVYDKMIQYYILCILISFFNGPTPASFCLFSLFASTNSTEKTVDFSGIRTRTVGVEGEHADHLTTTTADIVY